MQQALDPNSAIIQKESELISQLLQKISCLYDQEYLGIIQKHLQALQSVPKTYSEYMQILESHTFLNSVIDIFNHDVLQEQNNEQKAKQNEISESMNILHKLIRHISCRSKLQYVKNFQHPKDTVDLFKNINQTIESINKTTKLLRKSFHPDAWQEQDQKQICKQFFQQISSYSEDLKTKIKKHLSYMSDVEQIEYFEQQAQEIYQIGLDYRNSSKKKYHKLKQLAHQDIISLTEVELQNLSQKRFIASQQQYRIAMQIADKHKVIRKQVKIRMRMALCFYKCNNHQLDAQIAIKGAIIGARRLHNNNLQMMNEEDFIALKKIHDKINRININPTTVQWQDNVQANNPNKNIQKEQQENQQNQQVSILLMGSQQQQKQINIQLDKEIELLGQHLICANRQISIFNDKTEFQLAQQQQIIMKVVGITKIFIGGAVIAGSEAALIAEFATIASSGAICIAGVGLLFFGVFAMIGGYKLYKKGNEIMKEPIIRKKINEIISQAISFYDQGDYHQFMVCLNEAYMEENQVKKTIISYYQKEHAGKWILEIERITIIKNLLKHGFRPDGIATLLCLIGESLLSSKLPKLHNKGQSQLTTYATDIFIEVSTNPELIEEANKLDQQVHDIRKTFLGSVKSTFKSYFGLLKDDLSNLNHHIIASQYIREAQEMTFQFKLQELQASARINLIIIRIVQLEEDGQLAKEEFKKLQQQFDSNYQFIGQSNTKLDNLADFFQIIFGEPIETIEQQQRAIEGPFKKLDDWQFIDNVELLLIKASAMGAQVLELIKAAVQYQKQAIEQEKTSKIVSLRHWLNCQNQYKQALQKHPKEINFIIGNALCLLKLARYQEMLKFIDAIDKNSNIEKTSKFWELAAQMHINKNEYKEAKGFAIEALKLDSKNYCAHKQYKFINRIIDNPIHSKLKEVYQENKPTSNANLFNTRQSNENPNYNILSVDGGGMRGIIPALWLCEIENRTHKPISHSFNMMAGTSTGAIVSAALSLPQYQNQVRSSFQPRYSAYDILNLYLEKGKDIFYNKSFFFLPKYNATGRLKLFKQYFGTAKISQSLTDLVITAVNEQNPTQTHLFNRYDAQKLEFQNDTYLDALMASTAAPTYFQQHLIQGKGSFCDGGVNINDPTMSSYNEACRYSIPKEKIFALSMGTGSYIEDPFNPDESRGYLFWAKNFHKIALPGQEGNTAISMQNLLNQRYQRWQVQLDKPIQLDDYSKTTMNHMLEMGHLFIEEQYDNDENTLNKLIEYLNENIHGNIMI